MAAYFKITQTP